MVAQLSEVAGETFDYVIVGAGTAGLTVAARLAEDPSVSVAVLEAGDANLNDPKILYGGGFGSTWFNPQASRGFVYDWAFMTVPQKHSNDRQWAWNRGKGLGGSSAMNFYAWVKPPAADINAHEELGNPGWNWDSYQKYTCRSETYTAPSEEQMKEFPFTYVEEFHGTTGPVQVAIPRSSYKTDKLYLDTLEKLGAKLVKDPYGGDITGRFIGSSHVDPAKGFTRSDSATAFYTPNKDKPNFKVLLNATAGPLVLENPEEGGDVVATGIEFIHGGQTYVVHARKEIVLSAGTIRSPQILELSGIGRPDILEKIGVPVKVALPGVGENVQDHIFGGVSMQLDPSVPHETFDKFRNPEFAAEQAKLQEQGQRNRHQFGITSFGYIPLSLANPEGAKSFHARVTEFVTEAKKSGKLRPGLAEQYDIQLRTLLDDTLPDMEVVGFPGFLTFISIPEPDNNHISLLYVLQHPFSRGTIHAKSKDPLEHPDIDPHSFEVPFDLELLVEHIKLVRKLAHMEPLKSGIVREIDPGPNATSDEDLKDYLRKTCGTCFHAIGSLSMLPREKNGCVDPHLRVYGTKNVRVADLSIVPLHIAAHTVATAYGVGEKMADILKGVV
ncbi:hypothetical protein EIP91_005880 [Steccherinum ochraceum]|uniref:Glucose-methanol-choline oxidoreductase N-terminal domain-containing protein n=1 Tax=Steccherinum ochraceum TaxID=92696 RepID=A0A4R0R9D5_9APHY|nr:hypothetical protein EIP91_005880 [Steccherinum ochraceum]